VDHTDPATDSLRLTATSSTAWISVRVQRLLGWFHRDHVVRKIRRSEREKLVYDERRSDALLRAFYKLQIMTRRRHRVPPQPIRWFRTLLNCLPDQAKIRVAVKDGMPVASILTLSDGKTMIYKDGASRRISEKGLTA
jgi:Acetyltransferase (GNAT) domain